MSFDTPFSYIFKVILNCYLFWYTCICLLIRIHIHNRDLGHKSPTHCDRTPFHWSGCHVFLQAVRQNSCHLQPSSTWAILDFRIQIYIFIWFFKADKAIFSSLFRNFAFMAKYCWSSALKSMAHNNIAHDIVGKKQSIRYYFAFSQKPRKLIGWK